MSIYQDMQNGRLDHTVYETVTSDGFGFYQISPKSDMRDTTGARLSDAKDGHWKFHFTVDLQDIEAAWDIVYKVLNESEYAHRAKVVKPKTARSFANPNSIQAGKMITLYTYDAIKPGVYQNIVAQIEGAFALAGIKPGPQSNADRIIPGGRYTSYRAESGPDGEYIASKDLQDLPRELRYNPLGMDDPFASMRLKTEQNLQELKQTQQRAQAQGQDDRDAKTVLRDIKIVRPPQNYRKGRLFILPPEHASKDHIQKALKESGIAYRMHEKSNGRAAFEFDERDLEALNQARGMKRKPVKWAKPKRALILISMMSGLKKMVKNAVGVLSAPFQNIGLETQKPKIKTQRQPDKAVVQQCQNSLAKKPLSHRIQQIKDSGGIPIYEAKKQDLMRLYNSLAANPPKSPSPQQPKRDTRGQRRGNGFAFGRGAATN